MDAYGHIDSILGGACPICHALRPARITISKAGGVRDFLKNSFNWLIIATHICILFICSHWMTWSVDSICNRHLSHVGFRWWTFSILAHLWPNNQKEIFELFGVHLAIVPLQLLIFIVFTIKKHLPIRILSYWMVVSYSKLKMEY